MLGQVIYYQRNAEYSFFLKHLFKWFVRKTGDLEGMIESLIYMNKR